MTKAAADTSPKTTRPRIRGVLARERLFSRIAESDAPIVWISGPPGAGKTTLAASFLEAANIPAVWYQVDSGDSDPATFFYYFGLAATRRGLSRRANLPLLPAEAPPDVTPFAQRYFRQLFETLPASTVIVLDNYQDAAGLAFETLCREAFMQVPAGMKVLVISLSDPPPLLARLCANRAIQVIDGGELRFTPEESAQMILGQVQMDGQAIAALHDRAGGWAAGLVLMAEYARRHGMQGTEVADSQVAVFDYFAGEIFDRETPENQRLLMLSAALPRLTARLAAAISGNRDAERVLEQLYRRHLFTDRRAGSEAVYQYHRLFRAFLLARAQDRLAESERAAAASGAALMLEADGQAEDAVGLYLEAEEWTAATRLIVKHAWDLYEQGRWRTLLDWIAALPAEVTRSAPWLAYWCGACQVWTDPPQARHMLEQAYDRFLALGDRSGQIVAAGLVSRAHVLSPDWSPLDKWRAALEAALADEDVERLPAQIRLIGYSRLLYVTFLRDLTHPRLEYWAERATALLGADVHCNEAVLGGFSVMTYYNLTGSTAKQEDVVRQIKPLLARRELSPVSFAYWQWAYSNFLARVATPREALAAIDEGLEFAENNGLTIGAVIRRYRAGHLIALGELAAAETELRKLEAAPFVEPYYELKSYLALRRGNHALAREEAHRALRLARERARPMYELLDLLLLAQACAETGAYEEAASHLADFRNRALNAVVNQLGEYRACLIESYIALRQSDREHCHARLRTALSIGGQQRYYGDWYWYPEMMQRLYTEALEHGIAVGYVQDVIRQRDLMPESMDVQNWPWPVTIHTLGRFEMRRYGEPIRFEGKAQRKPIELAKVLIALGGNDVPVDKLIDTLWPDPEEGGGQKAFEVTVHRLRALLGRDDAVHVSNRRASFDPQRVWIDVWVLERKLAAVVPGVSVVEPDIHLLEAAAPKILELYRGHFLPGDEEQPWRVPVENRLSGRFQRFVLRLGEHWESRGQWLRAAELYRHSLEIDPLAETFYRGQMICLHAQGQRAEALEVFRRCRQTLSIVLGVTPTRETEEVYRRLFAA